MNSLLTNHSYKNIIAHNIELEKLKKENADLKQKLADFSIPTEDQAKSFSDYINSLQVFDGHSISASFEELWNAMIYAKVQK